MSIWAQSCASVPPAPGWISKRHDNLSFLSVNNKLVWNSLNSELTFLKFKSISSINVSSFNSIKSNKKEISVLICSLTDIISFLSFNVLIISKAFLLSFQKSSFKEIFVKFSTSSFNLGMSKRRL